MMLVPAAAHATQSVSVTGDDGQPTALNSGGPLALRNMDVQVLSHADTAEGYRWSVQVLDPGGVPASSGSTCNRTEFWSDDKQFVNYRGNGTYTVILRFYSDTADTACAKAPREVHYQFTIGASVAVGQPAGPALTRQPNSFVTNTQALDFNPNPGASSYEIRYAKGGVIAPDGSISGVSQTAYVDSTTGKVQISAREPGDYVVVARARGGDYYTPWSPPITLKLMAPFDFSDVRAVDSIGPSYKLRGTLRETSAAGGRVTVAIAKGKKGKRFRTLGKPKINSKGVWQLRFKVRKHGYYRVRYSFKGSATVVRGAIYETVRIRRVLR
jgi:hypothetical protein